MVCLERERKRGLVATDCISLCLGEAELGLYSVKCSQAISSEEIRHLGSVHLFFESFSDIDEQTRE